MLLGLGVEGGEILLQRLFQGGDFGGREERPEIFWAGFPLAAGMRKGGATKDTVERVVVGGRDGIKLVIVATRATQRQAEKGAAGVFDGVLDGQMGLADSA